VGNGEEFSHMGRRGEKWEKIGRKTGEKVRKNFSHREKARILPIQPTAITKSK